MSLPLDVGARVARGLRVVTAVMVDSLGGVAANDDGRIAGDSHAMPHPVRWIGAARGRAMSSDVSKPSDAGFPPGVPPELAQAPALQRVLVLYSDERLLPANVIFDHSFCTTLQAGTSKRVEFHSSSFSGRPSAYTMKQTAQLSSRGVLFPAKDWLIIFLGAKNQPGRYNHDGVPMQRVALREVRRSY